jgi:hypothetical protein
MSLIIAGDPHRRQLGIFVGRPTSARPYFIPQCQVLRLPLRRTPGATAPAAGARNCRRRAPSGPASICSKPSPAMNSGPGRSHRRPRAARSATAEASAPAPGADLLKAVTRDEQRAWLLSPNAPHPRPAPATAGGARPPAGVDLLKRSPAMNSGPGRSRRRPRARGRRTQLPAARALRPASICSSGNKR